MSVKQISPLKSVKELMNIKQTINTLQNQLAEKEGKKKYLEEQIRQCVPLENEEFSLTDVLAFLGKEQEQLSALANELEQDIASFMEEYGELL